MAISARAVAEAITSHVDGVSGIDAYLAEGPTPPAGKTVVIYPDAGRHDGPLGDPDRDLVVEFQTTSIGTTPVQALWVHDQVAGALWRTSLAVDGSTNTHPIYAVPGSEQPVRRDDALASPLFYVTCSWIVTARPST